MKYMFAIIVALFAIVSHAQQTITLTPEQAAALVQSAPQATQPAPAVAVSTAVRQEASEWGRLGANMGKALVAAAEEIGVAANEFAATPLGKVTVAIVVYKLVGESIVGLVVGGLILATMGVLAVWFLRTDRFANVKYEHVPVLFGLFHVKRVVQREGGSEEVMVGRMIGAAVCVIIGLVVGLNVMF